VDFTAGMKNEAVFPAFFVTYDHYEPQQVEKLFSVSHSSRDKSLNPTDSLSV